MSQGLEKLRLDNELCILNQEQETRNKPLPIAIGKELGPETRTSI